MPTDSQAKSNVRDTFALSLGQHTDVLFRLIYVVYTLGELRNIFIRLRSKCLASIAGHDDNLFF